MPSDIPSFRLPRFRDIPDVGLYLDQTVKYINRLLKPLGCIEITSSMVSNYVKKGYIANPVRKQYSAEQIAGLIFIAIVKGVISMENIDRLFDLQRSCYTAETAYDYFADELENVLFHTFGLKPTLSQIGATNTQEKQMLRSVIIAVSNIIYLSDCFDNCAQQGALPPAPPPEGLSAPLDSPEQGRCPCTLPKGSSTPLDFPSCGD